LLTRIRRLYACAPRQAPQTRFHLRRLPASLTSAAPRRRPRHPLCSDCHLDPNIARRSGEEAHAQTCLHHRRRSHGRQAEARPVPRSVSLRERAGAWSTWLTTTQASQDQLAAHHPQRRRRRPLPHCHQSPILSAQSPTVTRPTIQG
jgi:hypothetical protein